MKKTLVLIALIVSLAIPINALPTVLPIINQEEFKSCFFNWCQTTAPSFLLTNLIITNTTYYVYNGTINNITNNYTMNESEPMFNANYTIFNPFYNQTTPAINYFNSNPFNWLNYTYNATYDIKFNTTAISNLNMTTKNITFNLVSASTPTCINYYNTTGSVKFCDCYNNTHKWVANSC